MFPPSPDDARVATRRVRRSRRRSSARYDVPARSRLVGDRPVSSRANLAGKPPGATGARANVNAPLRASRTRAVALRLRRTYVAGDRDRPPTPAAGRGLCIAAADPTAALVTVDRLTGAMPAPTTLEIAISGGNLPVGAFSHGSTRRPRAPPRVRSPPKPSRPSTRLDAAGIRDGRATRDVSTNGGPAAPATEISRASAQSASRDEILCISRKRARLVDVDGLLSRLPREKISERIAQKVCREKIARRNETLFSRLFSPPSPGDDTHTPPLPPPGHLPLRAHVLQRAFQRHPSQLEVALRRVSVVRVLVEEK